MTYITQYHIDYEDGLTYVKIIRFYSEDTYRVWAERTEQLKRDIQLYDELKFDGSLHQHQIDQLVEGTNHAIETYLDQHGGEHSKDYVPRDIRKLVHRFQKEQDFPKSQFGVDSNVTLSSVPVVSPNGTINQVPEPTMYATPYDTTHRYLENEY